MTYQPAQQKRLDELAAIWEAARIRVVERQTITAKVSQLVTLIKQAGFSASANNLTGISWPDKEASAKLGLSPAAVLATVIQELTIPDRGTQFYNNLMQLQKSITTDAIAKEKKAGTDYADYQKFLNLQQAELLTAGAQTQAANAATISATALQKLTDALVKFLPYAGGLVFIAGLVYLFTRKKKTS